MHLWPGWVNREFTQHLEKPYKHPVLSVTRHHEGFFAGLLISWNVIYFSVMGLGTCFPDPSMLPIQAPDWLRCRSRIQPSLDKHDVCHFRFISRKDTFLYPSRKAQVFASEAFVNIRSEMLSALCCTDWWAYVYSAAEYTERASQLPSDILAIRCLWHLLLSLGHCRARQAASYTELLSYQLKIPFPIVNNLVFYIFFQPFEIFAVPLMSLISVFMPTH